MLLNSKSTTLFVYEGRLKLCDCGLTDSGATAIGQAIAKNRVLTVFLMYMFVIGSKS